MSDPNRAQAWALLCEFTKTQPLRRHGLSVEASMRALAHRAGVTDPAELEKWGVVGLLHDFDYERWPSLEDHPLRGSEILAAKGYPEWFRRAILSHGNHTGVARETVLEKCLFASDELTGFVTACSLVTPSKSFDGLAVASVRKRMKDKAFARSVSRDDIVDGAAEIGLDLDAHIAFVIDALRGHPAIS